MGFQERLNDDGANTIDGYNLGSDWYLRLADQAGKMLRGEIPVTSINPITPP